MNAGFQRYHRIVQHLTGREIAHIQRMDVKGQLWRVSNHCKTRIELYVSKAYGEMHAAAGHPLLTLSSDTISDCLHGADG